MPSSLTTALNLSHNCFSGSILSSSFSSSPGLEILDLSSNNFSGPVPDSLTSLQSLTLLDLSNNNLSGKLPTFHSWVNVKFSGNALLSNSSRKGNRNFTESLNEIDTGFRVALIISFVSGMVASFSLAFLISKCLKKPEVSDVDSGFRDRIISPSVETPSLNRYLEMVRRWQHVARMGGPRQQGRQLTPIERYRAIAFYV
jgi:Leucine rich repeat